MSLNNLPVEWSVQKFEKVVYKIVGGGTPSKSNPEYYQGNIPWMSVKDMNKNILEDTVDHITQDAIDNSATNLIPKGTPIIATRMSLGKVVVAKFDSAINQDLKAIFFGKYIDNNFFVYWYRSLAKLIESLGTGTTVKGIRLEVINNFDFPVVPLVEQQEIVRQLDVMLAQVEQIKARLDAIPAILKKFRQSVLADAVSGKLTEEWRNSLQSNKNLDFETYIAEYRIQKYLEWEKESLLRKGKKIPSDEILLKKFKPVLSEEITHEQLPKGWSRQLLDGLIYISARIGWKGLKAEEYTQEGPLFLSVHGLNYGKVVRLDQAFHISQERYVESPEIALKNDDILLCKDGAGIGKVGIVKGLEEPASINSSLLLIRSGEIFVPEFLYYVFKGPYIQKLVQERLTGTAIPHLFQRDIKEFLLDIPPLDEQNLIVEKVEAYFNWVGKIEQTVQSAQKRVNLLTQSILAKAFSGELTADWREQHQDLITGVNSAEALLAKIQSEREASKPVKNTRKKKEV